MQNHAPYTCTLKKRDFLLELGISMPRNMAIIRRLATVLEEHPFPPYLTRSLLGHWQYYDYLTEQIEVHEKPRWWMTTRRNVC